MLYHLFHALEEYDLPGGRLFEYITFRSGLALVLSLFIAIVFGKKIIERLQLMQVGEIVRNLGLQGQMEKKGTPTMGGIIIIISILIPCLLLGKLNNVYMVLMIVATIWCGALGFADDYLKIKKHNKEGMKGKFKIVGQVGLGLIVGLTMYLSPSIVMNENVTVENKQTSEMVVKHKTETVKSTKTTIPFVKNHNFDYAMLTKWMGDHAQTGGWIVFILVTIFVVAAVSNGANLNAGMDGMCAGNSAIICVALGILAYVSSHIGYAAYFDIMYIPDSQELVIFLCAFVGALIGFLWYNAYPAQVFMGDTGSLAIGGIIAVTAIIIHKELLIPILCFIFFIESISVMLQVQTAKFGNKRGKKIRFFKRAPIHDTFRVKPEQLIPDAKYILKWPKGCWLESKITTRFWIITVLLAALAIITLKVR